MTLYYSGNKMKLQKDFSRNMSMPTMSIMTVIYVPKIKY